MIRFASILFMATIVGATSGLATPATAQDAPQNASPAPGAKAVLTDYDAFLSILRTDYAGFEIKTAGDKAAEFERLAADTRAALAEDPRQFDRLMDEMVRWFEDRHLGLRRVAGTPGPMPSPPTPALDVEALKLQGRMIGPGEVEAGLTDAGGLAGEWVTLDKGYTLALIPDPADAGRWVAVVRDTTFSTWAPGQVKFTVGRGEGGRYDVVYQMGDHSERPMQLIPLPGGTMLKLTDGEFVVFLERPEADNTALKDRLFAPQDFTLTRLSNDTLLLRLPDFAPENRTVIEGHLAEHHEALTSTPNLVIDARYNNGGSDGSYSKLMKYLYTRPIYAIGVEFRATERNIAAYEALIEQYRNELDAETLAYLDTLVIKARANVGGWIVPQEHGFSIVAHDKVMPYPKRVGILTEGAGSSGDQFVIDARFSRKVTTFGKPTAGVIDFSNVVSEPLPSGRFEMSWPMTRSLRLPEEPYDNVGVAPDVPFGEEVADPVGYVQAWLERQVD